MSKSFDEEVVGILEALEKELVNTYKADGCRSSAITMLVKNRCMVRLKALFNKVIGEEKKCRGCETIIYPQDYCKRCKRLLES